jgi:hypothetical protein
MAFSLLKRSYTKRLITGNCKFPVRQQLIPVQINPDLYHTKLPGRKITGKKPAVVNGYGCFAPWYLT